MPGPLGPRDFFTYVSDDGNEYVVSMDADKALAGGLTPAAPGVAGANYIRGWTMRHVYGQQADGTRCSLPVSGPDNSLYVNGGTFNYNGNSYTVRGRIGEKRPSG